MRMLYAIVFRACLLLAAPNAASAQTPVPDCGSAALRAWGAAIDNEEGTIEQRAVRIANRYVMSGVLFLPTASPELITTRAGVIGYFTSFVATKPKVTFTECKHTLTSNAALFAGFYYFRNTTNCPQGRLLARFSFLIRSSDNLIVHHHSSVLPPDNPCRTPR